MHPIQKKIVILSQSNDLSALSLREIGRLIGEGHPQKVKHHMQQLGFLPPAPGSKASADKAHLISIPLLGLANCGEATIYAESYEGRYLQVSQSILPHRFQDLFSVQAVGDSMNQANINGENIEGGDFVIINPDDKDFKNGDYVLSLINGMANIKKFTKNVNSQQVVLLSESSENHPPIYIHEDDMSYFMTSGKVIAVLKHPEKNSTENIVLSEV